MQTAVRRVTEYRYLTASAAGGRAGGRHGGGVRGAAAWLAARPLGVAVVITAASLGAALVCDRLMCARSEGGGAGHHGCVVHAVP